jgi:hypothetical protein
VAASRKTVRKSAKKVKGGKMIQTYRQIVAERKIEVMKKKVKMSIEDRCWDHGLGRRRRNSDSDEKAKQGKGTHSNRH